MKKRSNKIKAEVRTEYGSFEAVFTPEPDMGGYMITVPSRGDVVSWGKNLAHAKRIAKEAIECAVEGDILTSAEREGRIRFVRAPRTVSRRSPVLA